MKTDKRLYGDGIPDDVPVWLIDGIPAYIAGPQPRPQPGESGTYEIFEADIGSDLLTSGFGFQDPQKRYEKLRDRARHSGSISSDVSIGEKVIYSIPYGIVTPDTDPLVAVEPGRYDECGTAIWGLVTGVDDSTMNAPVAAEFSMDIMFVADFGDYPDKQAVRKAHEHRGFH